MLANCPRIEAVRSRADLSRSCPMIGEMLSGAWTESERQAGYYPPLGQLLRTSTSWWKAGPARTFVASGASYSAGPDCSSRGYPDVSIAMRAT